ncbi:hypothetical protein DLM86_18305 [Paenibacillus flagellatus]|uniref:DUF393 domain-containing protein n=2 Tax=Paenibacillus flagellatus TaxID=2211139 RepID=A0A2V5K1W5_9BACL|nr:hypothetical protein DLM86_18305 [Paenibacillus flagellatus]
MKRKLRELERSGGEGRNGESKSEGRGDERGEGTGQEASPKRGEAAARERDPAEAVGRFASESDGSTPGTFMLVVDGRAYIRSRAGLEVLRRLNGLWPLLYAFVAVPAPLRDRVYDFVARNRYRWFGRSDSCLMPTPDTADRFIR